MDLLGLQAIATLATRALDFGMKVYDDTPKDIRVAEAANWGKFVLGVGNFILQIQEAINKLGAK